MHHWLSKQPFFLIQKRYISSMRGNNQWIRLCFSKEPTFFFQKFTWSARENCHWEILCPSFNSMYAICIKIHSMFIMKEKKVLAMEYASHEHTSSVMPIQIIGSTDCKRQKVGLDLGQLIVSFSLGHCWLY